MPSIEMHADGILHPLSFASLPPLLLLLLPPLSVLPTVAECRWSAAECATATYISSRVFAIILDPIRPDR